MTERGFDFCGSGIQADWNNMNKKKSSPVTIRLPSVLVARAFHYQYKDFEWQGDNGTQTIIIRLKHDLFDRELLTPQIRLIVNTTSNITPELVNSVMAGIVS